MNYFVARAYSFTVCVKCPIVHVTHKAQSAKQFETLGPKYICIVFALCMVYRETVCVCSGMK